LKHLNLVWQQTVEQLQDSQDDSDKPEIYKNPEKAWGATSKPHLPSAHDFLTELQRCMNKR